MIVVMKVHASLIALLTPLLFSTSVFSQVDSLVLNNGNIIVGELKSMDRGVLMVETGYSDSDFKIEWEGVSEIYATTTFMITLSNGIRYHGTLASDTSGLIIIDDRDLGGVEVQPEEVVFLRSVDEGFISRLYASIDLGFSVTKANNLRQVSMRSKIGYLSERWQADASYNNLYSTQDETDPIRRIDGGLAYRYYLPKDWYLPIDLTFLSNSEQLIALRMNAKVGLGKYMIHTNNSYWGFAAGASYVNENFSSDAPDKNSLEGYFGSELNLYDIGDLSLLTKAVAYPSFTESGRWRADFVFDTKYDLPYDFYIKIGFTINYDSQPVEGATDADYVLSTGIGWEL
jgi:hypothetical protein